MMMSKQTFAPVTLTTEIDVIEFVHLREALKNDFCTTAAPSYNVLLTKVVTKALCEYPNLNASINGSEIVYCPMVNIGMAVDTECGLIIPIVSDVMLKLVSYLMQKINNRIAMRTMLVLSLIFVGGAQAARFLQRIKQFCEQPYLWLS
jgi:pyruvate dehydrogenase E2 component (dihydrolipoamide acetyltransferase)